MTIEIVEAWAAQAGYNLTTPPAMAGFTWFRVATDPKTGANVNISSRADRPGIVNVATVVQFREVEKHTFNTLVPVSRGHYVQELAALRHATAVRTGVTYDQAMEPERAPGAGPTPGRFLCSFEIPDANVTIESLSRAVT